MLDLFINLSISDYFSAQYLFNFFVENASYLFVFLFMVVESSFIPFPSEVVVPPAAFLACTRGDMNIFVVVLLATAGALVGALINYILSYFLGRPVVYAFADSRIGHACLIDRTKVEHAEEYFDKHGAASTFIGRLIPAVRQLISIPAGLARMNIVSFSIFTFAGALVWNIILALLGWWLSRIVTLDQLFDAVEKYNGYLTVFGFGILGLCVLYILYKGLSNNKKKNAQ